MIFGRVGMCPASPAVSGGAWLTFPPQGGVILGVKGLVYAPSAPSCPYGREWEENKG